MDRIYLDHSATTAVDSRVLQKMLPYFTEIYGNANSQHSYGRDALKGVDWARDTIANLIGAKSSEVYFTSGGTEADNWALKGIAEAYKDKGKKIIMSSIEHHAMLATGKQLQDAGYTGLYAPVNNKGIVDLEYLKQNVTEDTLLVSVMLVNNEIGTIQPIKEIVKLCKEKGVLVHTDAVQAMSSMAVNVKELGVDLMSFSSHKFNGPKGLGALYVRNGLKMGKLIVGGHQERTRRGGTTNVPAVVGMAEALRLTRETLEEDNKKVRKLRDYFISRVESEIKDAYLNGDRENRVVSNANFSFKYIEGESILFMLDLNGICVSSGSACSSGSLDPSHVLLAIGVPIEVAHGSIRFSFGKENTKEQVDYVVEKLKEIIKNLRAMSPLYSEDNN